MTIDAFPVSPESPNSWVRNVKGLTNSIVMLESIETIRARRITRIGRIGTAMLMRLSHSGKPHIANAAKVELAIRFGDTLP